MELRKVLIADGSDDFLLAMAQALQQHFHVLCCRDGKQALSLLRSEHCDLLVLDEVLGLLDNGIIEEAELQMLLRGVGDETDIILTGINLKDSICELADRVSVVEAVK